MRNHSGCIFRSLTTMCFQMLLKVTFSRCWIITLIAFLWLVCVLMCLLKFLFIGVQYLHWLQLWYWSLLLITGEAGISSLKILLKTLSIFSPYCWWGTFTSSVFYQILSPLLTISNWDHLSLGDFTGNLRIRRKWKWTWPMKAIKNEQMCMRFF